ncbi:hypothetical protein YC2023_018628 [Brassica napus]
MKRRFMGSSKKKPTDSRMIRKSTREASIDTLQAASIGSVNQASNDTIHPVSDNTVHHGTVHFSTVHRVNRHCSSPVDRFDIVSPPSIDTVHRDTVHHDTVHPGTVYPNTVHPDTVHPDTVHLGKNDTTCGDTVKIKVLILKVDENGMLRDEEGRTRKNA